VEQGKKIITEKLVPMTRPQRRGKWKKKTNSHTNEQKEIREDKIRARRNFTHCSKGKRKRRRRGSKRGRRGGEEKGRRKLTRSGGSKQKRQSVRQGGVKRLTQEITVIKE